MSSVKSGQILAAAVGVAAGLFLGYGVSKPYTSTLEDAANFNFMSTIPGYFCATNEKATAADFEPFSHYFTSVPARLGTDRLCVDIRVGVPMVRVESNSVLPRVLFIKGNNVLYGEVNALLMPMK